MNGSLKIFLLDPLITQLLKSSRIPVSPEGPWSLLLGSVGLAAGIGLRMVLAFGFERVKSPKQFFLKKFDKVLLFLYLPQTCCVCTFYGPLAKLFESGKISSNWNLAIISTLGRLGNRIGCIFKN